MEIKKADSKGRVTGFDKGRHYRIVRTSNGTLTLISLTALESALAEDLEWLDGKGVAS